MCLRTLREIFSFQALENELRSWCKLDPLPVKHSPSDTLTDQPRGYDFANRGPVQESEGHSHELQHRAAVGADEAVGTSPEAAHGAHGAVHMCWHLHPCGTGEQIHTQRARESRLTRRQR